MNTPVNFEISKLLKEKGFVCIKSNKFWRDGFSFDKKDYNSIAYQDKDNVANIVEVVMWLYEKYRIWISVDVDINGRFRNMLRKYNNNEGVWEIIKTFFIDEYDDSPTKAYLSGIEYTLKNLV